MPAFTWWLEPILPAASGVLQSSELGFGVYRRLGFEKVCEMEHFHRQAGG